MVIKKFPAETAVAVKGNIIRSTYRIHNSEFIHTNSWYSSQSESGSEFEFSYWKNSRGFWSDSAQVGATTSKGRPQDSRPGSSSIVRKNKYSIYYFHLDSIEKFDDQGTCRIAG